MRWEKVSAQGMGVRPGNRWGHTCNAIAGGKLLYVFSGYGKDDCQTNQVHVFDCVNKIWSEPATKGAMPMPRDSHSCTTVGDNLYVFGGTDGTRPLGDLHILDTSSNIWISPSLRGDGPEPREGHSAALIGRRLFIFGGCGKSEDREIYYDDLYILNTETFMWKRVVPSGTPPTKRESHSCSSWRNKIIVIGGEDTCNFYLSDVHILDTGLVEESEQNDRRTWKLYLTKQLKLKCQEHQASLAEGRGQSVYMHEQRNPLGKKTFHAKVTKSFPDGYTIETVIYGKHLCGV